MEQINIENARTIAEQISNYVNNDERLCALFTVQPHISLKVYEETAKYYANQSYNINVFNKVIPHGFFQKINETVQEASFLRAIKKYDQEITLIAEYMQIDKKEIQQLIKNLKININEDVTAKNNRFQAAEDLQELIRKFTAKYKEDYINKIINQKLEEIKGHIIPVKSVEKELLEPEVFIKSVLVNPNLRIFIEQVIYSELGIPSEGFYLKDVLNGTFIDDQYKDNNNYTETAKAFNIIKPENYSIYLRNKDEKRLHDNFIPALNSLTKYSSKKEKEIILYMIKLKSSKIKYNPTTSKELEQIKQVLSKEIQQGIEKIATLIASTGSYKSLSLKDDKFYYELPPQLSKLEKLECSEYEKAIKKVKKIHDQIYKCYKRQQGTIKTWAKSTNINEEENQLIIDENNQIDISYYLNFDKVKILINQISLERLHSLNTKHFEELRSLLVEKGLLWAYISGNIDLDTIALIINNFDSIAYNTEAENINIENLEEIIKNAKLFQYASDLVIGLVGIKNVAKIINYNQFVGTEVTDEVIYSRLRKVIDLSVRSERTDKSSLPFNCNVQFDDYSVLRYLNNDPNVFACGIDTKTCFFISVNENDFFFYSLLNKNGYIVKVENNEGELVARASCFRKNNILMINGIRFKNNNVLARNAEECTEFKRVVELIKIMAEKMITLTSNDICPIDYVVCNRAGILENSYFDRKFEKVNEVLFTEPINIYDEDWQEFIHLYDNQEQMLQEVSVNGNKSFTTDFGCNYPAVLIASRNNMGLLHFSDISYNDQPATYERPRKDVQAFIGAEITDEILEQINRIRALNCFYGSKEEQDQKTRAYKLLRDTSNIKNIILGEDWYIASYQDGTIERVLANPDNRKALEEVRTSIENYYIEPKTQPEENVKLYIPPTILKH